MKKSIADSKYHEEPNLNQNYSLEHKSSINNLTIKQVSQITGLPSHTLRFWEKEFAGFLTPDRTSGGQRRYNGDNISIISTIKRLKQDGVSLNQIKDKFDSKEQEIKSNSCDIDLLARRVAKIVKNEVEHFFSHGE